MKQCSRKLPEEKEPKGMELLRSPGCEQHRRGIYDPYLGTGSNSLLNKSSALLEIVRHGGC